jgi:hypothetical protein
MGSADVSDGTMTRQARRHAGVKPSVGLIGLGKQHLTTPLSERTTQLPMAATSSDTRSELHAAVSSALDARYLAPQDAYFNSSAAAAAMSARKRKERARSASRRRKVDYKKLLWFRQPCENNQHGLANIC